MLSIDELRENEIALTVSLDEKILKLTAKLPCLISMESDINTPRLPSYRVKKALPKDAVQFLTFGDFEDQDPAHYGLTGSATQVEKIFPPEKNTQRITVTGTGTEQTQAIFQLLCDKKVL